MTEPLTAEQLSSIRSLPNAEWGVWGIPRLLATIDAQAAEIAELRALISAPFRGAWLDEVCIEAAHQRDRWGSEHGEGKEPQDWFWLIGYLAGKALSHHAAGNADKARHHTVSTAAVMANWASAISGHDTVFRPGIGPDALSALPTETTGRGVDG